MVFAGLMGSVLATHQPGTSCQPGEVGKLSCNNQKTEVVSISPFVLTASPQSSNATRFALFVGSMRIVTGAPNVEGCQTVRGTNV